MRSIILAATLLSLCFSIASAEEATPLSFPIVHLTPGEHKAFGPGTYRVYCITGNSGPFSQDDTSAVVKVQDSEKDFTCDRNGAILVNNIVIVK